MSRYFKDREMSQPPAGSKPAGGFFGPPGMGEDKGRHP